MFLPHVSTLVCALAIAASAAGQVRVVSYNVAQHNGDPTALAQVLAEASADDSRDFAIPVSVFVFQEVLETQVADLQKLLGPAYTMGTFTDQGDSSWGGAQAMFYDFTRVVEHTPSHDDLYTGAGRHTDRWRLDLMGYQDVNLWIYSAHLKASTGSANQEQRRVGAERIRDDIITLGEGAHVIVAGDMNIYTPSEPAYQWFIADGAGQVIDPLGNATWGSSASAIKHTQSPRATSGGGLVGGGMDDRFDFQFMSESLVDTTGLSLIDGHYRALCNDGAHYNISINDGDNTYFPGDVARGNALADAMHEASDHIPLIVDLQVPGILGLSLAPPAPRVLIAAEASATLVLSNDAQAVDPIAVAVMDVLIEAGGELTGTSQHMLVAMDPPVVEEFALDTSVAQQWTATITTSVDDEDPQQQDLAGVVLAHANASFSPTEDLDWYTHEVAFDAGTGMQSFVVPLFNHDYNALQSLLLIDAVADPGAPIIFAGHSTDTVGPIPALLMFQIDTDMAAVGMHAAQAPIDYSDEDVPGDLGNIAMLSLAVEILGDACPGDVAGGKGGGDGVVNVLDLLAVIAVWGSDDAAADINGDGLVGVVDLLAVISAWGPCP